MKYALRIYTALIIMFLYAPLLIMFIFSFNSTNSLTLFEGVSLRWYRELFRDTETLSALKNTIILAVASAAAATVIGTAAAVGIDKMKRGWKKSAVMTVTNIPMMNPDIVTGISLMLLFVFVSRILKIDNVLGFGTLLIAHITFNLPYVILSILPKLRQLDRHLPEAAQDLGCTPLQSFFRVTLPSIMPGVVTGMIMSFTLSLDDFVISYFANGPDFQTLPIRIYSMTKRQVTPDTYALSTLIFVSVLLLLVLYNGTQAHYEKKAAKKIK